MKSFTLAPSVRLNASPAKRRADLDGEHFQIVVPLVTVAVDVVDQRVHAGRPNSVVVPILRLYCRRALGIDVAVPDDVGDRHPRLLHLAREQLQTRRLDRVAVDVRKIEPHVLLVEARVEVLVRGATVRAAAGRDLDARLDLGSPA